VQAQSKSKGKVTTEDAALDADVFSRWVLEGGMEGARRELARALVTSNVRLDSGRASNRFKGDAKIVYGIDLARPKL